MKAEYLETSDPGGMCICGAERCSILISVPRQDKDLIKKFEKFGYKDQDFSDPADAIFAFTEMCKECFKKMEDDMKPSSGINSHFT